MRILFLNRYFYPSQAPTGILLSDLAFALSKRGASVIVITSRLTYEDSDTLLPRRETIYGVDVYRVWKHIAADLGFWDVASITCPFSGGRLGACGALPVPMMSLSLRPTRPCCRCWLRHCLAQKCAACELVTRYLSRSGRGVEGRRARRRSRLQAHSTPAKLVVRFGPPQCGGGWRNGRALRERRHRSRKDPDHL